MVPIRAAGRGGLGQGSPPPHPRAGPTTRGQQSPGGGGGPALARARLCCLNKCVRETRRGDLLELRVRPVWGVARGGGRGAESAGALGQPWSVGRGQTRPAPERPRVALVSRTLRSPNDVSLPTGPPSARGDGAVPGGGGARGGRYPGEAALALLPRAHSSSGAARAALGSRPGRSSGLAPPAQPAQLSRHQPSGRTGRAQRS